MKKLLSILIIAVILFSAMPAYASTSTAEVTSIEYFADGSYMVTVIEDVPDVASSSLKAVNTETKSKTAYYYNQAGDPLWYIRVTGTFTYGNGSARCTSVSPSSYSYYSSWKVVSVSGSKSGASATTRGTGQHIVGGTVTNSVPKVVTLTCSPTGVFS